MLDSLRSLVSGSVDRVVSRASGRDRLFTRGWGDDRVLDEVRNQERTLWPMPAPIEVVWDAEHVRKGLRAHLGAFRSPLAEALPHEAKLAKVLHLQPDAGGRGPAIVLLAASGEEGFDWRTRLIGPLVDAGLHAFAIETPYYGLRRPSGQVGSQLRTVSDLLLLHRATVEEARSLLLWLSAQGYGPLGVAGFSMGGQRSALVAVHAPSPVAVVAMAAGRSSAPIYTVGELSHGVAWGALAPALGGVLQAKARLANLLRTGDLDRFAPPARVDAATVVCCRYDGYVSPAESEALHKHWSGSELRHLSTGHAAATITGVPQLRRAIAEAMERIAQPAPGRT